MIDFKRLKIKVVDSPEKLAFEAYNLAHGNAVLKINDRIIVNYIRHHLSNYDRLVISGTKNPYKGLSKDIAQLKWLVLEKIKQEYCVYIEECSQQQKAIVTKSKWHF